MQALTNLSISNEVTLLEQIAKNTADYDWFPGFIMSLVALAISGFSLWYTKRTFNSQEQTERNTAKLNKSEQRRLLMEMIRHLYRNMVASYTIEVKMRANDFAVYPSEEHLKKMKMELSDIHLELFYRSDEEHKEMNKFYMELRNYNIELDVICDHFRNPNIDKDTKVRDFRTLCYKCNYLTERITELICGIWNEEKPLKMHKINVYEEVCAIIDREIKDKNSKEEQIYTGSFKLYDNRDSFYVKELYSNNVDHFLNGFNENVRHECGLNSEGADKIHMIAHSKK